MSSACHDKFIMEIYMAMAAWIHTSSHSSNCYQLRYSLKARVQVLRIVIIIAPILECFAQFSTSAGRYPRTVTIARHLSKQNEQANAG